MMRSHTNGGMESLSGRKTSNVLKPFGCIVWDNVPKENRQKHKLFDLGIKGFFLGYVSSSTYNHDSFGRKTTVQSHNLTFSSM